MSKNTQDFFFFFKDLIKDLKSETSGKFEQLLVALMTPIHEFYASEIHHAISGIGTNESTLIEVLCSLSNAELHYIKAAYEKSNQSPLRVQQTNLKFSTQFMDAPWNPIWDQTPLATLNDYSSPSAWAEETNRRP